MKKILTGCVLLGSLTTFAQQPTPPTTNQCRLHQLNGVQEASTKYVLVSPIKQLEITLFTDGTFVQKEMVMATQETFMSMGNYVSSESGVLSVKSDETVYKDFIATLDPNEQSKYQHKSLQTTWKRDGQFLDICFEPEHD